MKISTHLILAGACVALVTLATFVMTLPPTQPATAKIKTLENGHTAAFWTLEDGSPYAAHDKNCVKCAEKEYSNE